MNPISVGDFQAPSEYYLESQKVPESHQLTG
jgi:hypothetical protein